MAKIYGVVSGPYHTSDVEGDDNYDEDTDGWFVCCSVEQENGSLEDEEIFFDTFDEAFEVVDWFKASIIPYEIDLDD